MELKIEDVTGKAFKAPAVLLAGETPLVPTAGQKLLQNNVSAATANSSTSTTISPEKSTAVGDKNVSTTRQNIPMSNTPSNHRLVSTTKNPLPQLAEQLSKLATESSSINLILSDDFLESNQSGERSKTVAKFLNENA